MTLKSKQIIGLAALVIIACVKCSYAQTVRNVEPKENGRNQGKNESAKKNFDLLIRKIAMSNKNDEITREAKAYVKRLDEIERLKSEKRYYENQARIYQDKYIRASNLTVSERMNLRDYAIEIAGQENISPREASMILDSNRPEDQAQKRATQKKKHKK